MTTCSVLRLNSLPGRGEGKEGGEREMERQRGAEEQSHLGCLRFWRKHAADLVQAADNMHFYGFTYGSSQTYTIAQPKPMFQESQRSILDFPADILWLHSLLTLISSLTQTLSCSLATSLIPTGIRATARRSQSPSASPLRTGR